MLSITNLTFEREDRLILKSVNLTAYNGQTLHIQGANGSGKSTLLALLSGYLPAEGAITYNGVAIEQMQANYQKKLCYIGHKLGLSEALTIRENSLLNVQRLTDLYQVNQAIQQFGLQAISNVPIFRLSAGQKKRAALLRLLLVDAPIWLLDEPFNTLDNDFTTILIECINRHCAHDGMVIITSHSSIKDYFNRYQEYYL